MQGGLRNTFIANTVTGVIALVPVAIVGLLAIEALRLLGEVAKPLALESRVLAALVVIGGAAGLVVLCFLVGSLVRTRLGSTAFGAMETRYLRRLPGYEPVVSILRGFAEKSAGYRPALVSLYGPGTEVFALVIEENGDGSATVFVPSAPTMAVGTVHVVARDRVRLLEASVSDLSGCIAQWGVGSRKIVPAAAVAEG
jgi:uncharacterized membrane protein